MKGGITSGAVYPLVIAKIAAAYDFKNVGGTSVGAVAAAATAAAEHRRQTDAANPLAGLAELAGLPEKLGGKERGEPRLAGFFRADPATRRTYGVVRGLLTGAKVGAAMRFAVSTWRVLVPAAAVIAVALVLASLGKIAWASAVPTALAVFLLAVPAAAVHFLQQVLRALPRNNFGFCRLGPVRKRGGAFDDEDQRPLTVWVHRLLRRVAFGESSDGPPLLFRDLWGLEQADDPADPRKDADWDLDRRRVNLELMTTDLTRGRAIRLPVPTSRELPGDPVDNGDLVFEKDELAPYFPQTVMDHLCHGTRRLPQAEEALFRQANDGEGEFYRLPLGRDLPVVVAVRMSLSFPILISTLPLWRLGLADDPRGGEPTSVAQRILLTDGGATSNFPVHFFDAALPRRPTFAVNLVGTIETRKYEKPGDYVVPPADRVGWDSAREVDSMGDFAVALKDAAQNWRDNAQAALPGYKERMFGLALGAGEGGLNLGMKASLLRRLGDRGAAAGDAVTAAFPTSGSTPDLHGTWNVHRFQRFRIAMALLDGFLRAYKRGYDDAKPPNVTATYESLVANAGTDPPYGFPEPDLRTLSQETVSALVAIVGLLAGPPETYLSKGVQQPLPSLRIGPRS
jgi:predicted acylesterase/phospholipase RssA